MRKLVKLWLAILIVFSLTTVLVSEKSSAYVYYYHNVPVYETVIVEKPTVKCFSDGVHWKVTSTCIPTYEYYKSRVQNGYCDYEYYPYAWAIPLPPYGVIYGSLTKSTCYYWR